MVLTTEEEREEWTIRYQGPNRQESFLPIALSITLVLSIKSIASGSDDTTFRTALVRLHYQR